MNIDYLIALAQHRQAHLEQAKLQAERIGDTDALVRYETELAQTVTTLNKLMAIE
jgi:hypothetical protein